MTDKTDLLVSGAYNSLHRSAMSHPDLNWPNNRSRKANNLKDSDRLCSLSTNGDWKCLRKSGFFTVRYYNPKEIVFQHMSVKENVFNDQKVRSEKISPFRNGDLSQHPTSVDIEEVVRSDVRPC